MKLFAAIPAAVALHWGVHRLMRRLRRQALRATAGAAEDGWSRWSSPLRAVLFGIVVLGWCGVLWSLTDASETLRMLREMFARAAAMALTEPAITIEGMRYGLLDLLSLPAALALLWASVTLVTRLLHSRLERLTGRSHGAQATALSFVRYTVILLGALALVQLWGFDVSSLAIAASVVGVGIGFGLQNLANNFISGLVVSVERPIQPGDFVQVGTWLGTVERIGARSTEIRTLDRVSILVPNSRFLDNEVINWSHGDPVFRLHVPVGVAYGSDVSRVRAALLEAAAGHPAVLADPRPRVEFSGFADSALQFELHVWARDPRLQFRLLSDLNFRIEAMLRQHRIQIPFPQRDVHLHSPQLEPLLRAWAKDHVDPGLLDEKRKEAAPAPRMPVARFADDAAPRVWSDAEADALCRRMQESEGLPIRDRRHLLRLYPRCFSGREAVDWMVRELSLSRDEALDLGRLLVARGMIHHVLDEHTFKDDNLFYRFRLDEAA